MELRTSSLDMIVRSSWDARGKLQASTVVSPGAVEFCSWNDLTSNAVKFELGYGLGYGLGIGLGLRLGLGYGLRLKLGYCLGLGLGFGYELGLGIG